MKLLMLDTETTGLDPKKDLITSMGWNILDPSTHGVDFRVPENHFLNYGKENPFGVEPELEALKINNITIEDLIQSGQEPGVVFSAFLTSLKQVDAISSWYLPFDSNMYMGTLQYLLKLDPENSDLYEDVINELSSKIHFDLKTLDTLLFPFDENGNRYSHRLADAAERLGVKDEHEAQTHTSDGDVELMQMVFFKLYDLMQVNNFGFNEETETILANTHFLVSSRYANVLEYRPDYSNYKLFINK